MGCGASKDGAAAPAAENKQKEQAPPAAAAPAPAAAERKEEAAAAPAPAAADPAPAAAEPAPAAAPAPAAEAEAAAAPKLKRKPEASRAAKPAPAMVAEKPAAERRWADAKALLPRKKTAEDKAKRQDMWKALDTNGNGMVSLAEFDKYAREVLKLDDFTNNLSPILIRAFNAAKAVDTGAVAENSDDFVTFSEFRLLLVNLAAFFELMEAFDEIDTSDDRRVSVDEFKAGLAKLKSWGVVVADPDSEFRKIDKDGAGMILFAEFASWGMDRRLDVDGDPDDEVVA